MSNPDDTDFFNAGSLPLQTAADLQDHLLSASHDLERLEALLTDACAGLTESFCGASHGVAALRLQPVSSPATPDTLDALSRTLHGAVTALQFQDLASQLIQHTRQRLRGCADRLARDTLGDDEDGAALVEDTPLRPNPVRQEEMDAGSIELF